MPDPRGSYDGRLHHKIAWALAWRHVQDTQPDLAADALLTELYRAWPEYVPAAVDVVEALCGAYPHLGALLRHELAVEQAGRKS